jgi:16S rRNA (guanine(966)-N(2))-methyltransferase RsmD
VLSPEGLAVRPTASKIRQAIFNILQAQVPDADFLDIFAGTGLMGIEALSRGAKSLVAIEQNRPMVRAIEASLKTLGYDGEVICSDYKQAMAILPPAKFDIVFADPPYKTNFPTAVVEVVERYDLLRAEGVLVIEHARGYKFGEPAGSLRQRDCRIYGQSAISFFEIG